MNKLFCFIFFLLASVSLLKAQGCSDAGFCTMGSNADYSTFKLTANNDTMEDASRNHSIKFSLGNALGEESVYILTPTVEASFQINNRSFINIKTNFQGSFGSKATKIGMGDIAITHSTNLLNKQNHQLILNVGAKMATGRSDVTNKSGTELPMVYQSSLGTFDFLAGLNYKFKCKIGSLSIAAGYQQPLIHINRNSSFTYSDTALQNSMGFKRKGDIFLRADKIFTIKKKFDLGIGVLAIYHIFDDEIITQNNDLIPIDGSQGITLNITALFGYRINEKFDVGLTTGFPVLVRDARPDGLTRKFVVSPSLTYRF